MADLWRRQTLASWDVLLDFDHATIATYAYLSTGPAATKTGCIRIHKRRLRRDMALKGTQVDAVLADLIGGRLIEVSKNGDVLTIYLIGMLVDCPPANPNTRRGYLRDIAQLGECEATKRAIVDLSETGQTDLQLIEHTGNRAPTLGQPSDNVVGHKRLDQTRLDQTKEDQEILAAPQATPDQAAKKPRPKRKTMQIPSPSEVQTYAAEWGESKSIAIDTTFGERFVAHYDSVDWMRGKAKIKSWEGTVRTWMLRDKDKNPLRHGARNPRPGQLRQRDTRPRNPNGTIGFGD